MAGRITLSKLKGRPSSTSTPVMGFRYDPGEEDVKEVPVLDPIEEPPPARTSRDSSEERNKKDDKATINLPSPVFEQSNNQLIDLSPDQPVTTAVLPASVSDDNLAKDPDISRALIDGIEPSNNNKDPREASPVKESVKDYLSKFGKKSSSLDNNQLPESDSWLSGWKNKITKRLEERIQSRSGNIAGPDKSPSKKDPEAKEDEKLIDFGKNDKGIDVENEKMEVIPVEEGQEVCEETIPSPAIDSHCDFDMTVANPPDSNQANKSGSLSVGIVQPILKVNRSPSKSSIAMTMSALAEPKIPEYEPDINTWEFVEQPEKAEEHPPSSQEGSNEPMDAAGGLPSKGQGISSCQDSLTCMKVCIQKNGISLLILIVASLIAPLPSFLSGFVIGVCVSAFVFMIIWFLFSPPNPKPPFIIPDYKNMPLLKVPRTLPDKDEPLVNKGWMSELPFEYKMETHHMNNTHSVFVRLDGSSLRLQKPKHNIPRRAMWNEKRPEPHFIHQRHFDMCGAKVLLLPERLSKARTWNKKYPICLVLPSDFHSTLLAKEPSKDFETKPATVTADVTSPESKALIDKSSEHTVLYLFARTCREKEEWYRRFEAAIKRTTTSEVIKTDKDKDEALVEPYQQSMQFDVYMSSLTMRRSAKYSMSAKTASSKYSIKGSYGSTKGATPTTVYGDIQWLNVLIGRIFYDFLTRKRWSEVVKNRIQKKLSKIKVPYFMEELTVADINVGTGLPYVHRASEPVVDQRGLWVDLDLTYNGAFQMTLVTKLNLMKLKKSQTEDLQSTLPENYEEDSAASSSDEEGDRADPAAASRDPSAVSAGTGKKLLHLVDRIAQSRYFQQATENSYIKRKMEEVSNTPLVLTVEVTHLVGTLALNIPPPPTDRLWYGFRTVPTLSLVARPKLGEKEVTITQVTERIEKMLFLEFQRVLVLPNMDDFVIPIMEAEMPGYSPDK